MEWISIEFKPNRELKGDGLCRCLIARSDRDESSEAFYNKETKLFMALDYTYIDTVTHWMPMPRIPE